MNTKGRVCKPTTGRAQSRAKPFTQTEQQARINGQFWLQVAKSYVRRGDAANAISSCLEGLWLTFGVSRPLAIRDELEDVLDAIDPGRDVTNWIQSCIRTRGPSPASAVGTRVPAASLLLGSHQQESKKRGGLIPIVLAPLAVALDDVHEPAVLLTRRGTGVRQGMLVFEEMDQFHEFVRELVQIHNQWASQCPFIPDPNCQCKQALKA